MSATYHMRGRVAAILPVETFPSGFQKQTLVLRDDDDRFPQEIAFDFVRDSIARLVGLQGGDEIEVAFSLNGHAYNGKRYVSLRAWGIKRITAVPVQGAAPVAAAPAAPATPPPAAAPAATPPAAAAADDLSDLPF